jgi:hypothetical protein
MKYVISEEELKEFINDNYYPDIDIDDYEVKDFLKDKSKVIEIASGKLEDNILYQKHLSISLENLAEHIKDIYNNKNIKLYIEEEQ